MSGVSSNPDNDLPLKELISEEPLRLNGGSTLEDDGATLGHGFDHLTADTTDANSNLEEDETEEEDFASGDGCEKPLDSIIYEGNTEVALPAIEIKNAPVDIPTAPPTTSAESLHRSARNAVASGTARPKGTVKLEIPAGSAVNPPVSAASSAGSSTGGRQRKSEQTAHTSKLYVCEGCFKYMVHPSSYSMHQV